MFEHLKDQLLLLQYAHVVWGFAVFLALALWAYRPAGKRRSQEHAALILHDDETPSEPRGRHGA